MSGDQTLAARHERWRQSPVISLEALTQGKPFLVIAPHPDDETLGCGGLIALARRAGIPVTIAVLTDGSASHPGSPTYPPDRLAALRRQELDGAAAALGVRSDRVFGFGRQDSELAADDADLMDALLVLMRESSIGTIFATWRGDSHPDHRAAFDLSRVVARRASVALWAYPVWGVMHDGDDDHEPAFRLSILAEIEAKRAAIACHRSQLGLVIDDSPAPFVISETDLENFITAFELFIRDD